MNLEQIQSGLRHASFMAKAVFYVLTKLGDTKTLSPALKAEEHAAKNPDGLAIAFEERRYSHRELDLEANRLANLFLKLGIRKGDVIALVLDNRPEYLLTIVAASKIGAVVSLINTHVGGAQLEHALRICSPKMILAGSEHLEKIDEIKDQLPVPLEQVYFYADAGDRRTIPGSQCFDEHLELSPDTNPGLTTRQKAIDPLLYIYTSGTTGFPKAALWTNQRFFRAAGIFGLFVLNLSPDKIVYTSGLPMYHSSGVVLGWGAPLAAGAACVMRRKFSASGHWDDCERFQATHFIYMGELCRYLYNAPPHPKERAHRIEAILGAGLRPEIWTDFQERFGIPKIVEFYGATEGNVGLVNIDGIPGMMGRLQRDHDVFLAEGAGEATIKRDANGHAIKAKAGEKGILVGKITKLNRFEGYLDKEKSEEKIIRNALGDGADYFNTGDLVQLHERRWVSFVDRLGDTFRWKGENVATNEVQEILNQYPCVQESTVFGVEVPHTDGRAGMAALAVGDDFDLSGFGEYVKSELPAYSRPLFLRLQRELKITATFKHIKTDLREDGFDPARMGGDPLYFLDAETGYRPLDDALYQELMEGKIRL